MVSEVLVRQYCNVAGISLLLYDLILTWEQEVHYVWTNSDWLIRSSFFIGRYWAMLVQIVNLVYSTPAVLRVRGGSCSSWLAFQTIAVVILLSNMELIMMIRVYALYEKSRVMGVFLVTWFVVTRVANAWNGKDAIRDMETNIHCVIKRTPDSSKWFSMTIIVTQCLLWVLTNQRYRSTLGQRWSEHPIVRMVMRDNTWTCIVFAGVLIPLLPYAFYVKQLAHILFPLLICIISIMSCRFILNMRSLKNVNGESFDPELELSTVITCPVGDSQISEGHIVSAL